MNTPVVDGQAGELLRAQEGVAEQAGVQHRHAQLAPRKVHAALLDLCW